MSDNHRRIRIPAVAEHPRIVHGVLGAPYGGGVF